jgi:hypothetical protein
MMKNAEDNGESDKIFFFYFVMDISKITCYDFIIICVLFHYYWLKLVITIYLCLL